MRKLLFAAPLLVALLLACENKPAVGPGIVTITETTTSTTTSTTTTSTIAEVTVAAFTFSPITPEILQVVTFDASTSKPGTGRTIVSYSWDFGDGVIKSGVRTTHDYTPTGVYLITLTVTDDQGKKTSSSQTITVRPIVP